jgi:hypothetical protein
MPAVESHLLPAGDCSHRQSNWYEGEVKTRTGEHTEGEGWPELLALHAMEEAEYFNCLAPLLLFYLENIGFVYPAMSMVVIGPSLLY